MNSSDRHLQSIILAAQRNRLGELGVSLRHANMALAFFVRHVRWITRLEVQTLVDIAELIRTFPDDWEQQAKRAHLGGRDRDITPVVPVPRILPGSVRTRFSFEDTIAVGDFPSCTRDLPAGSVNTIHTSPPYAEQRKGWYRTIPEGGYPAWTLAWMAEADRLLGDRGAVGIIIAPHLRKGAIAQYWHDTKTALFADGWKLIQDTVWWKPDSAPLGHHRRLRKSHEYVD